MNESSLINGLRPISTLDERIRVLAFVLDTQSIALATGVSATSVRKWMDGTEPRRDAARVIDDLRQVVLVLLESGFEPARIKSWLLSRDSNSLDGERPLECVSIMPGKVLRAANSAVITHRSGPDPAAPTAVG